MACVYPVVTGLVHDSVRVHWCEPGFHVCMGRLCLCGRQGESAGALRVNHPHP